MLRVPALLGALDVVLREAHEDLAGVLQPGDLDLMIGDVLAARHDLVVYALQRCCDVLHGFLVVIARSIALVCAVGALAGGALGSTGAALRPPRITVS